MTTARIYIRRNGMFGSSVPGCNDTGHTIHEDSGKFTVWSINGDAQIICEGVSRQHAEIAIAKDWFK